MKKLSTWLILLGILLLAVPIGGHFYNNWRQQQLYDAYLWQQSQQLEAVSDLDDAFAEETSVPNNDNEEEQTPAAKPVEKLPENVIGTISIPAISCDLLLLEGASKQELHYGAGHLTGTAAPGQVGNCAIAGHRNYTFGRYFSRLNELKEGNTVTVTVGQHSYPYVVYDSFVVEPSQVEVLDHQEEDSILTLITCTPKGSTSHRLIVRARLSAE